MSANKIRYQIESAILAEALSYEGAFAEMATWLKSNNFSQGITVQEKPFHRFIWDTMANMYPIEPINLFSVAMHIHKKYGEWHGPEINKLTDHLLANMNRPYFCVHLLEMDLRKSLLRLIYSLISQQTVDKLKLDLLEMEVFIKNEKEDVFDALDSLEKYFSSREDFELEYEQIREFKKRIDYRVEDIRQMSHIRSIMSNINHLYNFPTNRKLTVTCVIDILRYVLVSNKIPIELEDALFNLRHGLKL